MAIIREPQLGPWQSVGQKLGTGLEALAQHQINQMVQQREQRQQAQGLQGLLGLNETEALGLAGQLPQVQAAFIKDKLAQSRNKQNVGMLQGLLDEPQQNAVQQDLPRQYELQEQAPISSPPSRFGAEVSQIPQPPALMMPKKQLEGQANKAISPIEKLDSDISKKQDRINQLTSIASTAQAIDPNIGKAAQIRLDQTQKELKSLQERRNKLEDRSFQEEAAATKELPPQLKQINETREAAREINRGLDSMEKNIESGNMSWPISVALRDLFKNGLGGLLKIKGIDFSSLLTEETAQFEKTANGFIKQLRPLVGGKITNDIMRAWLSTFPNASNSQAANIRLIGDLRDVTEYGIRRAEIKDQIIEKNAGKAPRDIISQIDKQLESETNQLKNRLSYSIKSAKSEKPMSFTVGEEVNQLPPASSEPGAEYLVNGELKKSVNGEWVTVKG